MDVIYLTVAQVQELHDEAIAEFGGIHGIRSQELLESAVFQPQQSAFGEDAYSSFSSKAAAYAFFITSNHPFIDGNKRTAANAMLAFLMLSGFRLIWSEEEIENTIVALASHEITKDDFFSWVVLGVRAEISEER